MNLLVVENVSGRSPFPAAPGRLFFLWVPKKSFCCLCGMISDGAFAFWVFLFDGLRYST